MLVEVLASISLVGGKPAGAKHTGVREGSQALVPPWNRWEP